MQRKTLKYSNIAEKAGGMRSIILSAAICEKFRAVVYRLARELGVSNLQNVDVIAFIKEAAKDFVYVNDPHAELYQYPAQFAALPLGDCDCMTIYIASILQTIRIPHEMIFLFKKGKLAHVYLSANVKGKAVMIDFAKNPPNIWTDEKAEPPSAEFNENVSNLFAWHIHEKNG